MSDLLPCPFCGGNELSHGYQAGGQYFGVVQCHTCDAFVTAEEESDAIAAWNTRAPAPSPWQGMETAPKDAWILAQCAPKLDERWQHYAGRCFVVKHMGYTSDRQLDLGWSLFPGMGVGDDWLARWMPLPAPPPADGGDNGAR